MSELKITKDNFKKEVLESKLPVLLDFWAVWCGPCRMLAPVVEEIANEFAGQVKVGKVNVDEEPELSEMFSVMSIPMLVVIKNGKIVNTSIGYKPKEDVAALLDL
ncbi:MAG: thioredoxin [Oscillospiraceae bacterium]|nr:thioredoxin [Oscillospiraceae bacterium]